MLLSSEIQKETAAGKKVKTRHRLVVAAAILFQRRGFYGVGTEEIIKLAKAPRGSLYHHFPDGKEALACAAVDWVLDEMISHIRQLRLSGHSPEEVIGILAREIGQWLAAQNFEEGSLFSALAACLDGKNEKLAEKIHDAYRQQIAEYEQMLVVNGVNKKAAPSIATTILSEIEGATILSRTFKDVTPLNEAAERLTNLITKGRSQQ